MPDLPWLTPQPPAPHTEAYAMASRFETRTLLGAFRFLLRTPRVMAQIRTAPGAHGVTLRARPLRRTFWTLSAWESAEALHRFAAGDPHRSTARALKGLMKDSAFTYWSVAADTLPLTWDDALVRLDKKRPGARH
ncbi:DUF3291 domain-containing protein [Streptomyces sp. NPDC091272]|uniref:DUF3291 domain-containing protein n=1 Tax=Streptomyces sp. NPDC091272 TaxID=3365981 RepID=UPI0037F7D8B3